MSQFYRSAVLRQIAHRELIPWPLTASTGRFNPILTLLSAMIIAALIGCQTQNEQYESISPSQATSQLQEILPGLSDQASVIRSGVHHQSGSQFWVLMSPMTKIKPPSSLKATGPSECPAPAIFSFAQAVGARHIATGESFQLDPNTTSGQLWQWQNEKGSLRWRSASTSAGERLIVIEQIKEDR